MKCTMWGIQSIIMQYFCTVTRLNCGEHFESIEISNHYAVYQEIIQCCKSIILQKQNKQLIEKGIRFVVTRGGAWGEGEFDEGSQKVQTSSNKINKYQGCNIQHDKYNEHCCVLYMKVVKRVNRKSSHHKEIFKNFFNIVSI